jgi:hypothetical protein
MKGKMACTMMKMVKERKWIFKRLLTLTITLMTMRKKELLELRINKGLKIKYCISRVHPMREVLRSKEQRRSLNNNNLNTMKRMMVMEIYSCTKNKDDNILFSNLQ